MKFILIFLLILQCSINAGDYYFNTSDLSVNSLKAKPDQSTTSGKYFIKFDANTSDSFDTNWSTVNDVINNFGVKAISKDTNLSNPTVLRGYVDSLKSKTPTEGSTIANGIKEKMTEFDSHNTNTYTTDAILKKADANSTDARSIKTFKDFFTATRSRLANLKTVECYVTRKLTNSYYCPLPTKDSSFFYGGSLKDSKESSLEKCESVCKEPTTCISKDMGKAKTADNDHGHTEVKNGAFVEIASDNVMMLQSIEFNFKATYDSLNASKDLNTSKHGFKINVSYFDAAENKYLPIFVQKDIKVKELNVNITIYPDALRTSSYRIDFYDPYKMGRNGAEADAKLAVTLESSKLTYKDDKFWFCPPEHFKQNIEDCDGTLQPVQAGATTYNVCITAAGKRREPTYGAYYSQGSCEDVCSVNAKCVPTYKHLTNINPLSLPDSLKDIEIDCVDSITNTSCTKAICETLFREDSMPLLEKTWTNDDNVKVTVANGAPIPNMVRARVDVAGGLSANGSAADRQKVSLKEMAELSYMNMVETETYNVSNQAIQEAIITRNAYAKVDSGADGKYSVFWKLKPNSFNVDDNKDYYLYSLMEVDTQFRPMYGVYNTNNGVQSGETDHGILIEDKTYVLKTNAGYKIIKKTLNSSGQFVSSIPSVHPAVYSWGPIDAYKEDNYLTMVGTQFLAYSTSDEADYFSSLKFSSDKKWENNMLFESIGDIASLPGVQFKSQISSKVGASFTRVYNGASNTLESSNISNITVYGFYSATKLSYAEVLSFARPENVIYSSHRKQPEEIIPDGQYNTPKVNFFVSGQPAKMSVNADFTPSSAEEGKKTFIFMLLYKD